MFWVVGLCYFGSCMTHNLGITAHSSLWYRSYSAQTTPKGVPARSSLQCFMNMSKAWQPSIKYMSALFLHLQKRSSNYGLCFNFAWACLNPVSFWNWSRNISCWKCRPMHVCAAGGMQCLCVCVLVNLVRKTFQACMSVTLLQIFIINECMDASVPDTIV